MSELQGKSGGRKKTLLLAGAGISILALLAWGVSSFIDGKDDKKPKPPKISLIPATPPPPPPPPKIEKKPPEPIKEQKEVQVEQQVAKVEQPAPNPELKMEGAAGDGPSAFASGTITSEDLSRIGTGKGGLVNPFNVYSGLLKTELQRYLSRRDSLRRRQYRIEVRIWVDGGGRVTRSELLGGTGDEGTDAAIREALTASPAFSEPPPANMPQPIRLRIVTTGRT